MMMIMIMVMLMMMAMLVLVLVWSLTNHLQIHLEMCVNMHVRK